MFISWEIDGRGASHIGNKRSTRRFPYIETGTYWVKPMVRFVSTACLFAFRGVEHVCLLVGAYVCVGQDRRRAVPVATTKESEVMPRLTTTVK